MTGTREREATDRPESSGGLVEAVAAWRTEIGPNHVLVDPETLERAATATFPTTAGVLAVLRPADRSEVQACVRVANQHRIALYPISGGRNWGLGSRVPVRDGGAILDLSRMDRIVSFDESLAYVTVEPGVTFAQIHRFLAARGSGLFAAVIGGPSSGSLIGNAVDRGEGPSPYGERWLHACALEVVLPTGETLETGFARFPGALSAHTTREGVGPSLDGLFTQSNLGIVTRMTFWLQAKPNDFRTFTSEADGTGAVAGLLDALRPLVLNGTIAPHCVTLWNSYKVMAGLGRYPWRVTQGSTPLSLMRLHGREPWQVVGELHSASVEIGRATQAHVQETLRHAGHPVEFTDFEGHMEDAEECLGTPTDTNVSSTYWRKRVDPPPDPDPDRDRCGVVWLCPDVPFDGAVAVEALQMAEAHLPHHGFEPNLGLMVRSARSLKLFVAIVYDRDEEGEDDRAMECHDELLERLIGKGLVPYRLGVQSMRSLPRSQGYDTLLDRLKTTLDPANILAPGRYDFRASDGLKR